jgi:nitroimidazol reductase NimA-like FMN-containing flavoprotein (pyridoxamine 5'-phosphate oxidase superfamily)
MALQLENQLSGQEMERILEAEDHGCLCLAAGAEPYGVPLSYAFLDGHITFHCAEVGRKLDFLRANPRVCFVVFRHPQPVTPHDGKCSFPYESVISAGTAREITDSDERARWMTRFRAHFYRRLGLPMIPTTAAEVAGTRFFVIAVDQMTGRAKHARDRGPAFEAEALQKELVLPAAGGVVRARAEQGDAMGKPGRVELEVTSQAGQITKVQIGRAHV